MHAKARLVTERSPSCMHNFVFYKLRILEEHLDGKFAAKDVDMHLVSSSAVLNYCIPSITNPPYRSNQMDPNKKKFETRLIVSNRKNIIALKCFRAFTPSTKR